MKDITRSQISTTCQSTLIYSEDNAECLLVFEKLWLGWFYGWGDSQYSTQTTFISSKNLITFPSAVTDDVCTKNLRERIEGALMRAKSVWTDEKLQIVQEVIQRQRNEQQYSHHFACFGSTRRLRGDIPELRIMAEVGAWSVLFGPCIVENVEKQMGGFIKNIPQAIGQSLQKQLDQINDKKCITFAYENFTVQNKRRFLTERERILSDASKDLMKLNSRIY